MDPDDIQQELPVRTGSGALVGNTDEGLRMESLSLSLEGTPYAGKIGGYSPNDPGVRGANTL